MKAFEFSVVLSGLDHGAEDFMDRLFEAGCADATITLMRGALVAEFCRDASTLDEAIASALTDLRNAGARIERLEPDYLVSLSDIAKRAGLTRSALTNYAHGLRGNGFPAPVARITSDSPLYDWPNVADWLNRNGKLEASAVLEAAAIKRANQALSAA